MFQVVLRNWQSELKRIANSKLTTAQRDYLENVRSQISEPYTLHDFKSLIFATESDLVTLPMISSPSNRKTQSIYSKLNTVSMLLIGKICFS